MSETEESKSVRIERVFPIRLRPKASTGVNSSVSNQNLPPSSEAQVPSSSSDEEAKSTPPIPPPLHRKESDLEVEVSFAGPPTVSTSQSISTTLPSGGRFVSNKFAYHTNDNESAFSENSTNQRVYRCEDEPIHIPGAIQGFGALIAIRENEAGRYIVRVVSENSRSITGLEPDALFELRCFTDLLINSDKKEFSTRVRGMRNHNPTSRTNPDVFSLSLTSLLGTPLACFIAMQWNETANLIICEFEPKKDVFNPRHPPDDGLPADGPIRIIDNEVPEEERLMSTTSKSKPLHAVQVARETSRQIGSMELFHVLSEIQNQLATAESLPSLLDIIVGLVYELTSYHRVMVYQFDETAAGSVVSEIVDPRASTDIYRGLKFPASDIPKQARDLYLINKIRVLYDRDQPTARLVCRTKEDAVIPLDLTRSYLRAMSPIHIKYLENMGVRASMSISLTVDNKLWGLISCHSYGSGMRVALPVRELCRALGDLASTNIEKLIYFTRIKARKPLSNAPPKRSPSAYIAASSRELLHMFGADFGFLAIKGEARTIGKLFAYNEAIVLLQYIREKNFSTIFASQNITHDCAEISYPPGFLTIAGMLVVPLSLTSPDFLVFFRKGQTMEVKWAGNPHQKKFRNGRYLEPRASFRRWSEHVVGRSREWTEDQVESAAVLSTLYGRFIEVWRQKEAIVQKNRMTRLLIRNAGHEVRTPLNSIINYLEVALEEVLDERARQHLQKSLQASKSLVFQVNDLLNLTEAEESDFDVHEDNVDLRNTIVEVIASFKSGSLRHQLEIRLEDDETVPMNIRSDPSMLRQVISNLLTNAIENSHDRPVCVRRVGKAIIPAISASVTALVNHISSTESDTLVEIVFEDQGRGMSESELDALFQEFEQVLDDEENQATGLFEDGGKDRPEPVSLGLGLAMTARFVRLNCGQITIASELGKGTQVSINIRFRKSRPDSSRNHELLNDNWLPTPPLLTPEASNTMYHLTGQPGVLARSASVDTDLTIRQRRGISQRDDVSQPPGADILADMAQAVVYSTIPKSDPPIGQYPFPPSGAAHVKCNVLIAEDNPLNSRLLETRLAKRGYEVKVTVDGQACFETFKENPEAFHVILMDIQMPLVDGIGATRMIRLYEKEHSPPLSQRVKSYGRIPIIAVSASLSEPARNEYIESGFDGWILKPIDFQRLQELITGIQDEEIRKSLLYGRSPWNRGGFFKLNASSA